MSFVIAQTGVFDGERRLDGRHDVLVEDGTITAIDPGQRPPGVQVIDGQGGTLLPGLIDAHVHVQDEEALRLAARFGVTTVLDMGTRAEVIAPLRRAAAGQLGLADLRTASFPLARIDGHPHQFVGDLGHSTWPHADRLDEVPGFVADRIGEGADYLKAHLEDGRMFGESLPSLDPAFVAAGARAAHDQGRMMLVHTLTHAAAEAAVVAGADGLTHVFLDQPHSDRLISQLADRGLHVTATLTVAAALTGNQPGIELADDPRVVARLPAPWRDTVRRPMGQHPARHLGYALATVAALHRAGVPVLAGSDASVPQAPGLAHGASLHEELRLLVQAGLSPGEALRAATAAPAERFGLRDRGRITPGRRADLLLVDGDPSARIDDSLSIRAIWRAGQPVEASG